MTCFTTGIRRSAKALALSTTAFGMVWVVAGSCTSAPSDSSARFSRDLRVVERWLERGNEDKAFRQLASFAKEAGDLSPADRLDLAEALLQVRAYWQAGNLTLGLFREGSLAPTKGWHPEPEARHRTLVLLGKVLFFLSRAPLQFPESREEEARRKATLEWAESAFREVATGRSPYSDEALYLLAEVLTAQGKDAEAEPFRDRFLDRVPREEWHGEMALFAECWMRSPPSVVNGPINTSALWPAMDVTPPVKKHAPPPTYTQPARYARVEGRVIVQAIIDASGNPLCFRPLKALPQGLTEEAIEAISQWRFEPAKLNGEPVAVFYNLTVNFSLR